MTLAIKWQRLVEDSDTCDRCSNTEKELEKAVAKLKEALAPLNQEVELEKKKLSRQEFEDNPTQSNLILINGRPLEDWLDGEVGHSECCDVCGDEECRTITIDDKEYEVVPSELIIKAGLAAASQSSTTETNKDSGCSCSSSNSSRGCCC